MNEDNAKDYLPLVQALAEGKVIQSRMFSADPWRDCHHPDFTMEISNYRIKPEPREKWFIQYKSGSESGPYEVHDAAECFAQHDREYKLVCYREVIE